jgi:hypothetical protein
MGGVQHWDWACCSAASVVGVQVLFLRVCQVDVTILVQPGRAGAACNCLAGQAIMICQMVLQGKRRSVNLDDVSGYSRAERSLVHNRSILYLPAAAATAELLPLNLLRLAPASTHG